ARDRSVRFRLHHLEGNRVRRVRELRGRVRTDLDGETAGERVSLLVEERLSRTEIDGALPAKDAAGGLLELVAANGHRVERVALDRSPVDLLENLDPVEAGLFERRQEPFRGERADR